MDTICKTYEARVFTREPFWLQLTDVGDDRPVLGDLCHLFHHSVCAATSSGVGISLMRCLAVLASSGGTPVTGARVVEENWGQA